MSGGRVGSTGAQFSRPGVSDSSMISIVISELSPISSLMISWSFFDSFSFLECFFLLFFFFRGSAETSSIGISTAFCSSASWSFSASLIISFWVGFRLPKSKNGYLDEKGYLITLVSNLRAREKRVIIVSRLCRRRSTAAFWLTRCFINHNKLQI